ALASGSGALHLPALVSTLAFIALGWAYVALAWVWRQLPGLRDRGAWWPEAFTHEAQTLRLRDPRTAGALLHEWSGLALGSATVIAALATPGALASRSAGTQSLALALVSLAGLCWLRATLHGQQGARYIAGGLVALALSAEARWLGAANIQAFI